MSIVDKANELEKRHPDWSRERCLGIAAQLFSQQPERGKKFQAAYGRLGGNPMDRDWNVWCAAWDAAQAALAAQRQEVGE